MAYSSVSYDPRGFDSPRALHSKRYAMPDDCSSLDPATIAIMRMNNKQLVELAKKQPEAEYKNKERNSTLGLFVGVPVLSSLFNATITKGIDAGKATLSQKSSAFFKHLGWWGAALTFLGGYMGINNALTKGSDTLSDMQKEHPIAKLALNLGGAFLALTGANWLANKGVMLAQDTCPKAMKSLENNAASLGDKLNKSFVSKKIFAPMQDALVNFASKHPKIAGSSVKALQWSVLITIAGLLMKKVFDAADFKNKVKDNFVNLKEHQAQAVNSCRQTYFQ